MLNMPDLQTSNVRHKVIFCNKSSEEIKVINIYRYASWLLTSLFYLIGPPKAAMMYKIFVVLSLLVAAKLTTDLYIRFRDTPSYLRNVVLIETIGITLLLLPTGGISSPFIWYALNPVLVAASFLSPFFCWFNLIFYMFSASGMSLWLFNKDKNTVSELINKNLTIILVLILITLAVQLLSNLSKKLSQKSKEIQEKSRELTDLNKMLEESRTRTEESLENIMSLYQVVEAFTAQNSLRDFLQVFADYGARLTKTKHSFFWLAPHKDNESLIAMNDCKENLEEIEPELEGLWDCFKEISRPTLVKISGCDFLITPVKSTTRMYGLIGIDLKDLNYDGLKLEYFQKLSFMAEVSSVILERFHLEEIADNFILVEEQNRIANEIHDSVSQRMFSISCATHALKSKWDNVNCEQIQEQLDLIHNSSNAAMKELRLAIHRLSSKKKGEKFFGDTISRYLEDFGRLNSVTIDFNTAGDTEAIPVAIKRALYRIIYEASGNAVRHGGCKHLSINLEFNNPCTKLSINDDGKGFDVNRLNNNSSNGLGIYNMKCLAGSLKGKLIIKSSPGNGTSINITIPNNITLENMEEAL